MKQEPMKILTFTTLYPNAVQPNHAVFVENRLRHLVASGKVTARVVAPVPWFPWQSVQFGRYANFARVPAHEVRHGIDVSHPRYLHIPKIGMTMAPFLLAMAMQPVIDRMIKKGDDFDLIDAHYFYPDGVAAVMLGKFFKKPVVVTARGSDISVIAQYKRQKKMILWAATHAAGTITVCQALRDALLGLGANGRRMVSLRNGVDLSLFQPIDRSVRRKDLGLTGFTLLSVGYLAEHKGHGLIIEALPRLPDCRLLIAGAGPDREHLEALAKRLHVQDRVTFLGMVPHDQLRSYYGAVDAMVLASSREGWANVLLESMACGTPVIATNIWGTPEVVGSTDAGLLMQERSPQGIVDAVQALRAAYPAHEATRRYAEGFSWDDTTNGQIQLFERILGRYSR